jgi:hypothetical protein
MRSRRTWASVSVRSIERRLERHRVGKYINARSPRRGHATDLRIPGCDSPRVNPILATLPRTMKISIEQNSTAAWFRAMLEYVVNEVGVGKPGSATVLAKVSELLFGEAVRRYVRDLPAGESG